MREIVVDRDEVEESEKPFVSKNASNLFSRLLCLAAGARTDGAGARPSPIKIFLAGRPKKPEQD